MPGITRRGRRSRLARHGRERRQHLREHEPQRFLVVLRNEFREFENVRRQRRHVLPQLDDRLQFVAGNLGHRNDVDHDARKRATCKANVDDRAAIHGEPVGNPVVEGGARRNGKSDACNGHDINAEGGGSARRDTRPSENL